VAQIVVKVAGGELVLSPAGDGYWKADWRGEITDDAIRAVGAARRLVEDYRENPGDGYPGHRLALDVAKAVGGEAVLPPIPPAPPDAVP
jgi:hypothetical protein